LTQYQIPDQMTAVVLDSYAGVESLRLEQRPVPKPGDNEVLIKIAAASINPSDLAFLEGNYGFQKPTPVVPGFEASGTVVAVGSGLMARYLDGKRVACISQAKGEGVWAEYALTTTNLTLPLDKSISLEQGATSVINPLTAIALLTLAKDGDHSVVINTAAASALGQMVDRLGRAEGIMVVNIVRRQSQVELLKEQGAKIILNSSETNFSQQLHDTCSQHKPRLAFDAVAGPLSMQVLNAMPPHSKVTVYGGLSAEPVQADIGHLIFQDKVVDGFWLTRWLGQRNFLQNLIGWRRAQKLLATDLKSEIRAQVPLKNVQEAIKEYQGQMTGGKILLTP